MHRTRHSSLDYLGGGGSQEEWSEFLSTSMMALSTTDAEQPPLGVTSPTRRHHLHRHQGGSPGTFQGSRAAKPRGMSMNEALSPSPLSGDVWRPLGRRIASPPPTLTRSSSGSESASASPPSSDNQAEHLRAVDAQVSVMSTASFGRLGSSSSLRGNLDSGDAKLKQTTSFRGVVNSCLSSSGSSIYDSSSDEEQQERASTKVDGAVPAPPMDPSYAEACLPVLSQLPRPPRSISVDSGNGARAGSLAHVKSPVLGNRKDSQTWQLQDEEFLMTSPRFDSYNSELQENQPRQGNTGRGLRSYSMEYGNYPSSRQVRSQSMEGPQLFASAPPLEYPPSLSRSNSAGVAYDWPRSHADVNPSPPLPPDVRPSSGSGASHYPPPPPEAYYDVEFKRGRQEVFAGRAAYKPGEYVKVEADRGEDIGRIVQRTSDLSKIGSGGGEAGGPAEEPMGRKRHDLPTKKIICAAGPRECEMLNEQRKEEHEVFEVCKSKVRQRLLPMNVIDAEYQFDRHKLTFFFEADRRIDFRELVRDLFAIYKTRIWLQQVVPSGKKVAGNELEAN
ncbi:hypothetical protein JM16_002065 [Phytophthora kernoviae]|uniref:PSP1 C-terminal domain-containing protein n=1 Tax=Phytophthora kernoviae TaxID=325452 RepID=A0A8T0M101_9STRA|nr:hypothetical protein JM16_002065 [Phytophthora kernoviae]